MSYLLNTYCVPSPVPRVSISSLNTHTLQSCWGGVCKLSTKVLIQRCLIHGYFFFLRFAFVCLVFVILLPMFYSLQYFANNRFPDINTSRKGTHCDS